MLFQFLLSLFVARLSLVVGQETTKCAVRGSSSSSSTTGTEKRPLNIVLTNDDGFETPLIQSLFFALKEANHNVVMSAPYGAQSGTSGLIEFLRPYAATTEDSPAGTVTAGSPGVGPTTLDEHQFYVDGAVTSAVLYGVDVLTKRVLGVDVPDLVISGPNEGQNVGLLTAHSGTMGGAVTTLNRGIPSMAVSADGDEEQVELVGQLMVKLIGDLPRGQDGNVVLAGEGDPQNIGLNVNFPLLEEGTSASDYTFAAARVGTAVNSVGLIFAEDLTTCPLAAAFGASVPLPGLCLAIPYTDAGYAEDTNPQSEGNVISNGKRQIAVSVIEGTYSASVSVAEHVFAAMPTLERIQS